MILFPLIWLGALVVVVFVLVWFQADRDTVWLAIVGLIVAFAIWIALPNNPGIRYDTDRDGEYNIDKTIEIRQGLDLAGGVKVLLEADPPAGQEVPQGAMDEVRRIVTDRIDALGALEPVVQTQGDRRLIVELPGYSDPETAVELIRETALLEFVDFGPVPPLPGTEVMTTYRLEDGVEAEDLDEPVYETVFTGEILRSADVVIDPTTSEILVSFATTSDGQQIFGDYTREHIGQPLGIVLDGQLLSAPVIQSAITGGEGSISGDFDIEEAQQLATQLRYGALPVPLRVDSTSTVGPTLGAISVEASIRAGLIGIAVVLVFMLIYYRLPGIAASLALLVFALINFALYKFIPVTLTLPAITGFLISVGTAVDGNILIFERMKEELRAGKRLQMAVGAGFNRAWTSIRDSNLSTIIIALVLYAFGTSFGAAAVRGFAVTLVLGLLINLFTAVTVTRTFLHFLMLPVDDEIIHTRPWLMGL